MAAPPALALMPGNQELLVLLVIGLLLFGRRLPEVGRSIGKTVQQFRKGMQEFKAQMDSDETVREVRSTVRDFRDVTDPRAMLQDRGDDTPPTVAKRPVASGEVERETDGGTAKPADG